MIKDITNLVQNTDTIYINKKLSKSISLEAATTLAFIDNYLENNKNVLTVVKLKKEMSFWGGKHIETQLKKLEKNNYIKIENESPYVVKNFLSTKNLNGLGVGEKTCPWCGGKTVVLHEHHFPIPKHLGGTETEFICPGCHYEYHYLASLKTIQRVI